MTKRIRLLVPLLAALTLVTACPLDDESGQAPPETLNPAEVELVEDLPCGRGFTKVDRREHVAISVHHHINTDADVEVAPRVIELPDEDWAAELRIGKRLAANWCSDLIEEPHAEIDERWEIIAGTLTFAGDPPPLDGQPDRPLSVRATLRGVVAESPDGRQVQLDDLEVHNGSWGFYAG